jgi:folate-binding protein YgfZ
MSTLLERACLTAEGPDAAALLQSLLSNDVDAAQPGGAVYALLLTPKARVISDLELYNLGDRFVLACPPERVDLVQQSIVRARFRRKADIVPSPHVVVWHGTGAPLATLDTPAGPLHLLAEPPAELDPPETWEIARIEAGIPVFGREFDGESMPAEAGLVSRAVSFSKGCYPGQEPVARLHYRGHANRGLRGLELAAPLPEPGAAVVSGDREVGRASSPVVSPRFGPISLAVLRREVEDGDEVDVAGVRARVRPLPFAA